MSGQPIGFYFDFISPFAYLGSVAVERLAARLGRDVEWRPVLIGITILKIMGMKPLPQTPLKGPYLQRDFVRQAAYLDVPLARDAAPISSLIAPLPPMRAFVALNDRDPELAKRFGREVFAARWLHRENPSTPAGLAAVARRVGIDAEPVIAANEDPAIKQRLTEIVDRAIGQGVFGVPTFQVGSELFWGTDHLPQLEHWIETGGW